MVLLLSKTKTYYCYDEPFNNLWSRKWGIYPSAAQSARRPIYPPGSAIGPQSYQDIKAECQRETKLFEDPDFPPTDQSVFFSRKPFIPFEWKRPSELVPDPQFCVVDFSRFDVKQGELGDCWLIAAIANLTLHRKLFDRVVPSDQRFDQDYCGIFHFKFWQYGQWIEVVIDDRLPTIDGKLVFMHSSTKNEFWAAPMEKAYAKLYGSYEALKGGSSSEAMEDFTGGLTEVYDLRDPLPEGFAKILLSSYKMCSLLSASLEPDPKIFEAKLDNGLVKGHSYSITSVIIAHVKLPNGKEGNITLIRLRNPWGNEVEWNGAWSDRSPEWTCLSEADREAMGLVFQSDGEFWTSLADFQKNFDRLDICNLAPDTVKTACSCDVDDPNTWVSYAYDGSWIKGATAGGSRNHLETFAKNPQYKVTLVESDMDNTDGLCTCIVALLQKNRRKLKTTGDELLTVGFVVYKVENENDMESPLNTEYFRDHQSFARCQSFINLREISCRFRFPPGNYVVVPSTFEPNYEGEFLLRIYAVSNTKCETKCLDEKTVYEPKSDNIDTTEHDKSVNQFFRQLAGEDLQIDCYELQNVLSFALKKEFKIDEFPLDVCRSMIALSDVNRSGKLDLMEFKELWSCIRLWKTVFKNYDRDSSGSIDLFELADALREVGYKLSRQVHQSIVLRYSSKNNTIGFCDFIGCAVKLKTMMEIFRERDVRGTGAATFDLDSWVELTMYS